MDTENCSIDYVKIKHDNEVNFLYDFIKEILPYCEKNNEYNKKKLHDSMMYSRFMAVKSNLRHREVIEHFKGKE